MPRQSVVHHRPGDLVQIYGNCATRILLYAVLLFVLSKVIESRSLVKTLPGFIGDLPFTLETGYIGVGESDNVQLFYYFIESEKNPEDDPLMLWLTGGPGCSGLSGLLYEIGPFTFSYRISSAENPALELNPYAWTKVANIIFLDQPAGTGYSYAKTSDAYMTSDTLSAAQTYDFLRKWLLDHPEFLNNQLYIAGDSYCGIFLPLIVQEIYNGNEAGNEPWINIKGYMLGNPLTDRVIDYNAKFRYANHMALLSDSIYESAKENCHGEFSKVDPNNTLCINDLQVVEGCLAKIRTSHILEPWCANTTLKPNLLAWDITSIEENSIGFRSQRKRRRPWCRVDNYLYSYYWANDRAVQEALHVCEGTCNEWVRCNQTMHFVSGKESKSYAYDVHSSVAYHRNLTNKKCRALIYSGDHDYVVPYLGTLKWIESLNLPLEINWRPWFVEGQIAGYTMKYSNEDYKLTFATVKGGGHTAPEFRPKECLPMVSKWLADLPL